MEFSFFPHWILFFGFLFLSVAPEPVSELTIKTAWQAEDAGIETRNHTQCMAWQIYWKTQTRNHDLSTSDIELLAQRRRSISIYTWRDASKYQIPGKLLEQYAAIHLNWDTICRFYSRIHWFNSTQEAFRYEIKVDQFCETLSNASNMTVESTDETLNGTSLQDALTKLMIKETRFDAETEQNTTSQILLLNSTNDIELLPKSINLNARLLDVHQSIAMSIGGLCGDEAQFEMPFDQDEDFFNSLAFDVSGLGWNASQVREFMRDEDGGLDNIMAQFENISDERPFPSTQIIPWLKKVKYDQRTPPSMLPGHLVKVKIGLFVQSLSNFELTTMDYDMDVWLRMAWRDIRMAHGLSKPILINEFTSLRRIWRPDPFITNAKDAKFHPVTYLNFYMFIFPNGEIFMEIRTMLKYPHDEQRCGVRISSIGFTHDIVRFEWFSRKWDAIRMKTDLQLPELFLLDHVARNCDGRRKSGNYSCIEASFQMKRDIGYHLAQTYVPTSICVVFSWVGAWLPEEFVEGRILVSLTVFLTLSAENNAAKEALPKVSYVKAIDLWFGFTSTFVFATMIQALIIISLENESKKIKKKALANEEAYGKYMLAKMLVKSHRFHKIARDFDSFCKVMYPVTFILFLMIYRFVIIEGEEVKCLREDQA
ncbi:unnamed protein product, partial [Mesorhabditis belari]|uniref:Uncharacterized protein n=1 Tax=Mesorhabditis belari TaxID=2138241 RepID=A0AAF3FR20_9BILA